MLEQLVTLNLFAFLLILARVGAMFSVIPGIAAAYVPTRVRLILVLLLSFGLTRVLAANLPAPPDHVMVLFLLILGKSSSAFFWARLRSFWLALCRLQEA